MGWRGAKVKTLAARLKAASKDSYGRMERSKCKEFRDGMVGSNSIDLAVGWKEAKVKILAVGWKDAKVKYLAMGKKGAKVTVLAV